MALQTCTIFSSCFAILQRNFSEISKPVKSWIDTAIVRCPPDYFTLDLPKMETQKEDNSKEEAKKIKEEVNEHYRKKELDLAIQKYDEVILKQRMAAKFRPENYPKFDQKWAEIDQHIGLKLIKNI